MTAINGWLGRLALVADFRHMTGQWDGSPTRVLVRAAPKLLLYPRLRAVMLFRLSHWAWRQPGLRMLAYWCQSRTIRGAGAEMHPAARIGPGMCLAHSVGIVIGAEVVAGRDLVLHQGVTIGHGPAGGQPRLGDGVWIGAGSVVLGPVSVGDGARIGASAVVLADVPAGITVVGLWKGAE